VKKLLILVFALMSSLAFAQQTYQVIIPYPPGGGVDTMYRIFEKYCRTKNIDLVPVFRPGAEGSIGVNALANSTKNEKVIAITTTLSLVDAMDKVEFISLLGTPKFVLTSSSKSQLTTFADLENAIAQKRPLSIGVAGSSHHLFVNRLLKELNVADSGIVVKVPFHGGGQQIPAILGGHVDLGFMLVPAAMKSVSNGQLNVIASTSPIEGVNVVDLSKKFKNWKNTNSYGLILPKGVSPETEKFWQNITQGFLNDKNSQLELAAVFYEVPKFGTTPFKMLVEEERLAK
jgi:tripartite-type tricarboxylate transporter receptor subunit TctC